MSDLCVCTKHKRDLANNRFDACLVCGYERLRAELARVRNASHEAGVTQLIAEESLRSELAEKDRRIEELERELYAYDMARFFDPKTEYIITREQINKAWALANDPVAPPEARAFMRTILEKFGIVACPKCGGTKWCSYTEYEAQRLGRTTYECDCPNNGWVIRPSAATTEDSEQP